MSLVSVGMGALRTSFLALDAWCGYSAIKRKSEAGRDIVYPVNAIAFHPVYGTLVVSQQQPCWQGAGNTFTWGVCFLLAFLC
ncbi:uncharacterized protein LOC126619709 isoform X2 [Malus sylvestris]|uniref:uncharacterized protein LOC126619709 isoform X2 n=1 Tax=Malus sylvestris TaxID=3752 RepID=UPI0021AC18F3|nr:uncharacterized protein LOC126619709 isoform X2 [Malus sylvestris]